MERWDKARKTIGYAFAEKHITATDAHLLRGIVSDAEESGDHLSAFQAENAGLRAQLAAPLRLGRGPTLEEVETVAAKESDGLGWWLLCFDGYSINFEKCSLHVEDGIVVIDSGVSGYKGCDITDAIPLNAARQPCGVTP